MPNYATKKKLEHATGVDTSDLAAKKDFVSLKAEVDKLDISKSVNLPTSLNNLKVDKLKTVHVDLKMLSDVVDNKFVKKTKFNTLNTKKNLYIYIYKKFLMRLLY